MCILCDEGTLDRLTVPLETFGPGELAEAIRTARDAAGPGVMDYVEAVLGGELPDLMEAEIFSEVVVARAVEAGVLESSDAYQWNERLGNGAGIEDPRVQAFVSSCVEILDDYRLVMRERLQVLERFLEERDDGVRFVSLGRDGEVWFEHRGEQYAALTEVEAIEVVERELRGTLHTFEPELLLRYTTLPDTGREVLEGILAKPEEVAGSLLAGLIDLGALADDRVRDMGYAPFFQAEHSRPIEDVRFGEWIIVRLPRE
jgi:hypothetical protein